MQSTSVSGVEYYSVSTSPLDSTYFSSGTEVFNSVRFTRYSTPLINYSYKSGNYLGIWDKLYPSLITSFIEVAQNVIKPAWLFSPDFSQKLSTSFRAYSANFSTTARPIAISATHWHTSTVAPMYNYFNTINLLSPSSGFVNLRWVALNSLNQKFNRMFASSTTQQRVLAN